MIPRVEANPIGADVRRPWRDALSHPFAAARARLRPRRRAERLRRGRRRRVL